MQRMFHAIHCCILQLQLYEEVDQDAHDNDCCCCDDLEEGSLCMDYELMDGYVVEMADTAGAAVDDANEGA